MPSRVPQVGQVRLGSVIVGSLKEETPTTGSGREGLTVGHATNGDLFRFEHPRRSSPQQRANHVPEVGRRLPFRILVVQTDNDAEFQSHFHWHLEALDIRHVYIRPQTPRLNGKVERSHRVDDQEFYQLLDQGGISDDIHLFNEKLREWEDYYNYDRPHGALDGQTPYERLLAKTRAGSPPAS